MSLWDGQQREWLQAMGYTLLALAGDSAAAPPEATTPVGDEAAGPVGANPRPVPAMAMAPPAQAPRPSGMPPAPPPDDDAGPAAPVQRHRTGAADKAAALDAARRAGAAHLAEGPLWDALLRATGQSPALAARTLRELDVDIPALRADPHAKRQLWQRLRSLRKGRVR